MCKTGPRQTQTAARLHCDAETKKRKRKSKLQPLLQIFNILVEARDAALLHFQVATATIKRGSVAASQSICIT